MYAYRLAYDGRPFRGFQRQPDVPTVEGELFAAVRSLGVSTDERGRPTGYSAAGRTDAGVSAVGQTVAFAAPDWLDSAALNGELPDAIRAWARSPVEDTFHATRDATAREYVYYLYAPDADEDLAVAVMDRLSGSHDFHNLTPADDRTERELHGSVTRDGPFLVIEVRAPGFVHELVRRIAGLVRRVSVGSADLSFVDRVLGSDPLSGPEGIAPEPGTGLVLRAVSYPTVSFTPDSTAAPQAIEEFADREATAATRARVMHTVASEIGPDIG